MFPCTLPFLTILAMATAGLAADPNDWVNVDYVMRAAGGSLGDTSQAQQTITRKAASTAQDGPWSITKDTIKPPSGKINDYLSWAPYHWPDCNWCGKGSKHIAYQNDTTDYPGYPDSFDGDDGTRSGNEDDGRYENGGFDADDPNVEKRYLALPSKFLPRGRHNVAHRHHHAHHTQGAKRANINKSAGKRDLGLTLPLDDGSTMMPTPTQPQLSIDPTQPAQSTTTSSRPIAGTPAPANAAAKPKKKTSASCTPSPTKSLAPSATWTTCPYVVRDGMRNPDVDLLVGPDYAMSMSQSVLYNALSYALLRSRSSSQNVANFIDTYFLSPSTAMNPNMNFGQLVRGPGKEHQMGTFTGPLDMRGMVKVVNALLVLKTAKSPDWTAGREQAMSTWSKAYLSWLQTSDLGKELAGKANNHLTFYVNQVAALQMYLGDNKGALSTIRAYFKNQFQDQIAQSGEQPFEAARSRPYHYRAFNLEAMITNAKIADQLGANLWTTQSRYGATIQTALDYAMSVNPKGERVLDLVPHVASVAAAYGDPSGKYKAFLQKYESDYKSEAWWFYDQTAALPNSPAAGIRKREDEVGAAPNATEAANGVVPFECPAVFAEAVEAELEDGLYVTCEDLRPFYYIALL
ncbi:chondroitin AC/alginate lyase [Panus rudis PR-1116 ss-1]|nr:chondroitin AC/alginate lyase [Panus rudis PR-1116 ss-1]